MIEDLTPTQWAALAKLREARRLLAKSSRPPDRDGRRDDQGRDRSPDRAWLHHDRSGPARRPPSPRRADAGGGGSLRTRRADRRADHTKDARAARRNRTRVARRFVAAPRLTSGRAGHPDGRRLSRQLLPLIRILWYCHALWPD